MRQCNTAISTISIDYKSSMSEKRRISYTLPSQLAETLSLSGDEEVSGHEPVFSDDGGDPFRLRAAAGRGPAADEG
ncbi:hypothetical protein GCM10010520_62730 [Rhizobium viscosum]